MYIVCVFSKHFYTSPYRLTEVLTVIQCSLKSPYTNSQIYSLRNICLKAFRFPHQSGLLLTGLRTRLRTRFTQWSGLTDRSQPIRFLACSADTADVELDSQQIPYTLVVGSLMYAMVCTWPDIGYAIGVVSQFMSNPGKEHWVVVKWILCYLKGTSSVCL